MSADELKAEGNKFFSAKDYDKAIEKFSAAIEVDPKMHALYSNRSACYASTGKFQAALEDAIKCTEVKPDWHKAWSRKGAALHGLKKFEEATQAYQKALEFADEASKAGIQSSIQDVQQEAQRSSNPFAKVFGPDCLQKIAANPRLAPLLVKPGFEQKIRMLMAQPQMVQSMMQDQDIMQVFIELMGLQSQFKAGGEEEGEDEPGVGRQRPREQSEEEREFMRQEHERQQKEAAARREADRKKKVEEEEKKKKAAEAAKEKTPAELVKEEGTKLYLAKKFDEALAKYDEAFQMDPKNTIFLLNRTAVLFEQGKYDTVIEECDKALDHARENHADFPVLSKILTRKASACQKLSKYEEAIKLYNQALIEHRNAETLGKLQACEKEKKIKDAEAYYNPELAQKAKEDGNEHYKAGRFPEAVACYNDAIKRDPKNHIYYSNRAGALLKLTAFDDAIKDCDKCLEIEPTFARAYARKAQIYMLTKQFHRALQTYELGIKTDPENTECKEGRIKCMMKVQEVSQSDGDQDVAARAMQDPEIQAIMSDSYMQMVLQEAQKNPARLQEYMKDSRIAANINKLVTAGIIRTGPGPQQPQQQQNRRF